mgnify:FL=1
MRKANTILSAILLVIFMLHGIAGTFSLLGIESMATAILAWIGAVVLAAHTVLGILLTIQTVRIF